MKLTSIAASMMLLLFLGACRTPMVGDAPIAEKSPLYPAEKLLGTDSDNSMAYHAVVHYPTEHSLRYPGLIIGVEKSSSALLQEARSRDVLRTLDPLSPSDEWLAKKLTSDTKVMFISHVVKTEAEDKSPYAARKPCFVYNAYDLQPSYAGWDRKAIDNVDHCQASVRGEGKPFSDSWLAIKQIRSTIQGELTRADRTYTHVIVVVMGWNTEQIESVQNFNSIVDRLASQREEKDFRPYVIGVTWPSEWSSSWADVLVKAVSLVNKANDADELGAGWLGAVVEHAVLPAVVTSATSRKPLIVIGHSFGARATSHAVCRGTMLRNPEGPAKMSDVSVDWLIGLEGAYSLNRFTSAGAGQYDLGYPGQCAGARHLLFTASKHDTAASAAGILLAEANFAGTHKTYERAASEGLDAGAVRFATSVAKNGRLTSDPGKGNDPSSRLHYVDASEVIFYNAYGTGAGAHSDIYRNDTACMIWTAMGVSATCGQQHIPPGSP
jgi:hypothetical protein